MRRDGSLSLGISLGLGGGRGVRLGPELVVNGDFSAWTADDPDGWTVVEVGDATSNITENPPGECNIISDGTAARINQSGILTLTKTYKYTVVVSQVALGGVSFTDGISFVEANMNSAGTYSGTFIASGTDVFLSRVGATNASVDSISIMEVL